MELAPLLWQGDVPGVETGAPMFVRDRGPELNAAVAGQHSQRTAWLFVPPAPGEAPVLRPYTEVVAELWSPAPAVTDGERR